MSDINPFAKQHADIREGVRAICRTFDNSYWQRLEESSAYPEAFVQALTEAGWLAALIPEEYGGAGVGLVEASVILEEINRSGANSGACHAQMYTMGALLRHGSPEQKRQLSPPNCLGRACACNHSRSRSRPAAPIRPKSRPSPRNGAIPYIVNGQKVLISRVQHSDLMLLLARTTPLGRRQEEDGRFVGLPGGPAGVPRTWADGTSDPIHGQPRDQRAVLRQRRGSRRAL